MSVLRKTAGTALAGGAQVLSIAAKLMDAAAKTLRPPSPPRDSDVPPPVVTPPEEVISTAEVLQAVDEQLPDRGSSVAAPATPLLDETPHMRTSESHIEELAAQPATQVIAAVAGLSTDELRLLTEHELAHKNRRTVLNAIEKALTPAPGTHSGRGGGRGGAPRGQEREIVLPEAGGVPTSGTLRRSPP